VSNLRIIHINRADQATSLTASTTSGSLSASLMQTDLKGQAHRSTGTTVTYTLTWTAGTTIGAVALPATNLTATATLRARLYDATSAGTQLADTGTITACPGLNLDQWAWSGVLNVNAFAYGGASKASAWFGSNVAGVKRLEILLTDTSNPAGYIDCARIVAGPWWSPQWNADYGCTLLVADNTTNSRTDAGDLLSDRAPMHEEMSLRLPWLPEADRATLQQILRANGVWKPVFLSLFPGAGTTAEQDHMVYGKRKGAPLEHPFFNNWALGLDIEGW
jgi:hypothetical protein